MKSWPILVDFTMTSYLLFSNHVTMVTNFEKLLILPGFLLNFRKSHQISKSKLKSSESYEGKTEGVSPPWTEYGISRCKRQLNLIIF